MAYPEHLIAPMREDLTKFGVEEARTAAEVDRALAAEGTVLVVTNSVCGCAAGKARPAIGMALQNSVRPTKAVSVFAGADEAAVSRLRAILSDYPPSSPSLALFQNGKPVFLMHRSQIERSDAMSIAASLKEAFAKYCTQPATV